MFRVKWSEGSILADSELRPRGPPHRRERTSRMFLGRSLFGRRRVRRPGRATAGPAREVQKKPKQNKKPRERFQKKTKRVGAPPERFKKKPKPRFAQTVFDHKCPLGGISEDHSCSNCQSRVVLNHKFSCVSMST